MLANKLDRFSHPLEARAKVANTGVKTFRYEDGTIKNEVRFNFSQDPNARELWDWFEKVSESEQLYAELDRAIHYDRLGVNDALLHLQNTWDRKRLTAARQFLPLLDRVAKNEAFLHMARERAATLPMPSARPIQARSSEPAIRCPLRGCGRLQGTGSMSFRRIVLIVLDSVGIGELPDAVGTATWAATRSAISPR